MNELRFVAACLEGKGISFPSPDEDVESILQERKDAETVFRRLLIRLPKETAMEMEDSVYRLVNAWTGESFERGFAAGIRLTAQAFVRE